MSTQGSSSGNRGVCSADSKLYASPPAPPSKPILCLFQKTWHQYNHVSSKYLKMKFLMSIVNRYTAQPSSNRYLFIYLPQKYKIIISNC